MWLVQIEMFCRCKIYTRFERLSTGGKQVKYLINNFYTDYMVKYNILDMLG